MKLTIKLFGILMLLLGISLLIKPEIIFAWIEDNMANTSLYISAIVVRFIFGILFIITAKEAKHPAVIKFFGYLFILAAVIFIFIGHEVFQDFISSLFPAVKPFAPAAGLLSIVFGAYLIYAFSRNKEIEQK